MVLQALVARYGLLAIFVGAGIEGEAVVITGGILAHRGLVPLWGAMVVAAAGSCLADQLWFLAGRRFQRAGWVQRFAQRSAPARAAALLERHPNAFIFGFRFVYGLRTAGPIVIGMTRVPTRKFIMLNMLAAAIWGPSFTLLGFVMSRTIGPVAEQIPTAALHAFAILVAIAALGAAILAVRRVSRS